MNTRAGLVSRTAAFAVDAVILAVSLRMTAWILTGTAHALHRFAPPINLGALVLASTPLVVAIYFVAFWTVLGQTPGKWLLGVKVVAKGGGPVGLRRSLVRLFGYLVSALPATSGSSGSSGRSAAAGTIGSPARRSCTWPPGAAPSRASDSRHACCAS